MFDVMPTPRNQFLDDNGAILAGGKLYTYAAGTSTPQATYTDSTGDTANANPVVLDAAGRCDVWLDSTLGYKFVLTDSSDVTIWTEDNVFGIANQLSQLVDIAGALSILNNLSDLGSVSTALKNLGIAPLSYQTDFSFTSGQVATALSGQTFDGATYSSVVFDYEIQQGTTIFSNGSFSLQYKNSTWVLVDGSKFYDTTNDGVTFSISQATTVATLKLAEGGSGDGTLRLKKHYYLQSP